MLEDVFSQILLHIELRSVDLYSMRSTCSIWNRFVCIKYAQGDSWKQISDISIVQHDRMLSLIDGPDRILPANIDLLPLLFTSIKFGLFRNMKIIFYKMIHLNPSDGDSYQPTLCACEEGKLAALKWLLRRCCPLAGEEAIGAAAEYGHLNVLQWLHTNRGIGFDLDTMDRAAAGGNEDLVMWLFINGCQWGMDVFSNAARVGHIEYMEFLKHHNCPWSSETLGWAANAGNIQCMVWLRLNGCPLDGDTLDLAAGGGRIDVLRWLFDAGCQTSSHAISSAASVGSIECMAFLRDHGCGWSVGWWNGEYCCAAVNGHVAALQWLHENKCPRVVGRRNNLVMNEAVRYGKLDSMQWLLANGWKLDLNCWYMAIVFDQLPAMEWLFEHKCPGQRISIEIAARSGRVDAVKLFMNRGWKLNVKCFRNFVARRDLKLEVVQWLFECHCPWDSSVFASSVRGGNLEIMEWLLDNGCPWEMNVEIPNKAGRKRPELLRWLLAPERPWAKLPPRRSRTVPSVSSRF